MPRAPWLERPKPRSVALCARRHGMPCLLQVQEARRRAEKLSRELETCRDLQRRTQVGAEVQCAESEAGLWGPGPRTAGVVVASGPRPDGHLAPHQYAPRRMRVTGQAELDLTLSQRAQLQQQVQGLEADAKQVRARTPTRELQLSGRWSRAEVKV
jgi:hypothetical protein